MKIKKNNKSSSDLMGDIMEGYLDPIDLCEDAAEGLRVKEAIDLVSEYANSLEDEIEIC